MKSLNMERNHLLYRLIVIISLAVLIRAGDEQQRFGKCDRVNWTEPSIDNKYSVPREVEVGRVRHFGEIIPSRYNLNLEFDDNLDYNGSVEILFYTTTTSTDQVMINMHKDSPQIDYGSIQISPFVDDSHPNHTENCIEQMIYVPSEEILVMRLLMKLLASTSYIIKFGRFWSSPWNETMKQGSQALLRTGTAEFMALVTQLQMRHARTLFPCLDHPALKAVFKLCLTHPSNLTAVSNRMSYHLLNGESSTTEHASISCFYDTPIMSTYLLAFGLTSGYDYIKNEDARWLEVFAPRVKHEYLKWISVPCGHALNYMYIITQMSMIEVLPRITPFVVYPFEYVGMENMGLIALDGLMMENTYNSQVATMIIYHEIVHQWLGNLVTVESWNELCLQEGLTTYLEYVIWELHHGDTTASMARDVLRRKFAKRYNTFIKERRQLADELECYERPPMLFHMIKEMFGTVAIENFVKTLLQDYKLSNAGLDIWDELMANVTGNRELMSGYLRSWFTEPGPVTLLIQRLGNVLHIQQLLTDQIRSPRPMILKVWSSTRREPTIVSFRTEISLVAVPHSPDWLLVDPDGETLTRKVYDTQTYMRHLVYYKNFTHSSQLSSDRMSIFKENFCIAFLDNQLPLNNEFDPEHWTAILDAVVTDKDVDAQCKCCARRIRVTNRHCHQFDEFCKGIDLVFKLRYKLGMGIVSNRITRF